MPIHPTAIVHPEATVDPTASIGPFCTIDAGVTVGPDCRLISHVALRNRLTLGTGNVVHPFATLGGEPQDLKYKGEPATVVIGDHNVFREGVTVNIGTEATMETRIGSHCLLMAYSHVAHDCHLGDHVIMANGVGLAGHVEVGDHAIFGGLSGVHQFCRVGPYAFVAGGAMAAQDIPPYCVAQGDRAQLVGINTVGLKRAGWDRGAIAGVRKAFKEIFLRGLTRVVALDRTEPLAEEHPGVRAMLDFIRESERGVCPPRVVPAAADNLNDDDNGNGSGNGPG